MKMAYPRNRHTLFSDRSHGHTSICHLISVFLCVSAMLTLTASGLEMNVATENDLIDGVKQALDKDMTLHIIAKTLILQSPIKIYSTFRVVLKGLPLVDGLPISTLSCGDTNMGLIEIVNVSQLEIINLALQGCTQPGLHVLPGSTASISIENSLFTNFTRNLTFDRSNIPLGLPKLGPVGLETAALAIEADSFCGKLTIVNTQFTKNAFTMPPESHESTRRRRVLEVATSGRRTMAHGNGASSAAGPALSPSAADLLDTGTRYQLGQSAVIGPERHLLQQQDTALSGTDTNGGCLLLSQAASIHPGLEEGPWPDDMEAVIAVKCRKAGASLCEINLRDVKLLNNTGVATSGLYVLCDGVQCSVKLEKCTVHDNKLLWQNYINMEYIDDSQSNCGMFGYMMPWLTYTYPLIYHWRKSEKGLTLLDCMKRSNMTGRTLGAVVIHQRNSPASATVTVSGGSYRGNDGAAIMSTATDWSKLASNGNSGVMAHSADFTFNGVTFEDHSSGFPAVWLRWPRIVTANDTKVIKSTGAFWFDEVRDSVHINGCSFVDNYLSLQYAQKWLHFKGLITKDPQRTQQNRTAFPDAPFIGAGTFQVVMITMTTALGGTGNTASISDSDFHGNTAYMTGVLFVTASDDGMILDENNLPGNMSVEITNSNFTKNRCMQFSEAATVGDKCLTPERPIYINGANFANIAHCRFDENLNGGASIDTCYGLVVQNSNFTNNKQTYDYVDITTNSANGGGGIVARHIGDNGVRIENCTFVNNSSPSGGGAVMLERFQSSNITSNMFKNNIATYADGGALWLLESENQAFFECRTGGLCQNTFIANTAGRRGGAVAAIGVGRNTGWLIEGCEFVGNQAMVNPLINLQENALVKPDFAGGGAMYVEATKSVTVSNTSFVQNKVLRHAGGALRVVDGTDNMDSRKVLLQQCRFVGNIAILGGAVAVSRSAGVTITSNEWDSNSVTDPWAWPDTSPVSNAKNESIHLPLNELDIGYGGALYVSHSQLSLRIAANFTNNNASIGGAIAVIVCRSFDIDSEDVPQGDAFGGPAYLHDVHQTNLKTNGAALPDSNSRTYPYRVLFANNSALLGAAVFVSEVLSVSFSSSLAQVQSVQDPDMLRVFVAPDQAHLVDLPAIVFYNNTASTGGAVYLDFNHEVSLKGVRFLVNNAKSSRSIFEAAGAAGPTLLHVSLARDAGKQCPEGSAGAVCIVGSAGGKVQVQYSDFSFNKAEIDGGGIFISGGCGCTSQPGCFKVTLSNVNISGNTAYRGRGGGIFWQNEGIVEIKTCYEDQRRNVSVDTSKDASSSSHNSLERQGLMALNVTLVMPFRKPPAVWYGKLSRQHQIDLLQQMGGPTESYPQGLYMSNGSLTANDLGLQSSVVSALKSWSAGDNPGDNVQLVVNDTVWYGMPYTQLPCSGWEYNTAVSGDDMGTSPYFLLVKPHEDSYSSNTDMKLQITVHDWYGNNCTGDADVQPVVSVEAKTASATSPQVSGLTASLALNGSALFNNLKLRANAGIQNVTFYGRVVNPSRELKPDTMQVYVRPCGVNEFLPPDSVGECVRCQRGTYNMNSSAASCSPCPGKAECGYPGDGLGFLVPRDGAWHSSLLSTQVFKCPNPGACFRKDRLYILGDIQVRFWQVAQQLQSRPKHPSSDTEPIVADTTAQLAPVDEGRSLRSVDVRSNTPYSSQFLAVADNFTSEYLTYQCAEGYTGNMCGECAHGYGWVDVATCTKCPRRALNDFYFALATLLTAVSLAILLHTSLQAHSGKVQRNSASLTTLQSNFVFGNEPEDGPPQAVISNFHEKEAGYPSLPQPFLTHQNQLNDAQDVPLSPSTEVMLVLAPEGKAEQSSGGVAGDILFDDSPPPPVPQMKIMLSPEISPPSASDQKLHQFEVSSPAPNILNNNWGNKTVGTQSKAHVASVVRILITYLQVLAMLGMINLDLPNILDVFYDLCNQATSYPGTLVSLDCSGLPNSPVSRASARVVLTVLAPFYSFAGAVLVISLTHMLGYCLTRYRGALTPSTLMKYMSGKMTHPFLVMFSTIMFFYYPSVVVSLMSVFTCWDVETMSSSNQINGTVGHDSIRLWERDFAAECLKGSHLTLAAVLGVPGLLLVGIGWPVARATMILKARSQTSKLQGRNNNAASLPNIEVADYRYKWIWWESVILLRQMVIAVVIVYLGDKYDSSSACIQLLVIFFILLLTLIAERILAPYLNHVTGRMAEASQFILVITVYLLLYLTQIDEDKNSARTGVAVFTLIINTATVAVFLWHIVSSSWYGMLESSGLDTLDRKARQDLTYTEARNIILHRKGVSHVPAGSGKLGMAVERLSHAKNVGVASSKAVMLVMGNGLGSGVDAVASRLGQRAPGRPRQQGKGDED